MINLIQGSDQGACITSLILYNISKKLQLFLIEKRANMIPDPLALATGDPRYPVHPTHAEPLVPAGFFT